MSARLPRSVDAPQLLVSVATPSEAAQVAAAGIDFIDLKDPTRGALGNLPEATLAAIVARLGAQPRRGKLSATIGDLPATDIDAIMTRVSRVAACGVNLVKVGITRTGATELLDTLATCSHSIVPVFIADCGLDAEVLARAARLPFAALMIDTADKLAGSLLDRMDGSKLREIVASVQAEDCAIGLAGALRISDWPRIAALAPDFAGFRSAVCHGWRGGALDGRLLARLVSQARGEAFANDLDCVALEYGNRQA
jgi:(5-formylfuran-3-yl)methyl phosphate synthase